MAVTVQQVRVAVGRPLTFDEEAQAAMWIGDTLRIIAHRLGDTAHLDQQLLDQVVRDAVARRIKRPDDITQKSVTIDGDTTQRTYQTSTGTIEITDDEWELITPEDVVSSGAASIPLSYAPDCRPGLDRHAR